jgi:hypothetical protein
LGFSQEFAMPVGKRIFIADPLGIVVLIFHPATVAGLIPTLAQFTTAPQGIAALDGIDRLGRIDAGK